MQINTQPKERLTDNPLVLDVHSIFTTIQGEGPFTGHPAIFIRLGGCNLMCPGCDTEYSTGRELIAVEQLVKTVVAIRGAENLVVITGGEPFRQNITSLCNQLLCFGFKIQIETNGTLRPSEGLPDEVTVGVSPKTSRMPYAIASRADYFKYVLHHQHVCRLDGLPTRVLDNDAPANVARPITDAPIYLQPMDCYDKSVNLKNLSAVTASCMKYGYIVQLQTHKIIGVE